MSKDLVGSWVSGISFDYGIGLIVTCVCGAVLLALFLLDGDEND